MDCNQLLANINSRFADWVDTATIALNEVTLEVKSEPGNGTEAIIEVPYGKMDT